MLHVDDSYKLVLYMTVTNFGFIIYRRLRPKHSLFKGIKQDSNYRE